MSNPILKIYGERNTGTNYLFRLVQINLPQVKLLPGGIPWWLRVFSLWIELPRDLYFALTFRSNLGWKHAMAPSEAQIRQFPHPDRLYFVTLTKNPYAWLLSLYRRPYHWRRRKPKSFALFLQQPWKARGRENFPPGYFRNPIDLWNQKNRSYLDLADYARVLPLRYEDLVADPEGTIASIAQFLGIGVPERFINFTSSTKGDPVDFQAYRDYYLQEKWRAALRDEDIQLINRELAPDVMQAFRYSFL